MMQKDCPFLHRRISTKRQQRGKKEIRNDSIHLFLELTQTYPLGDIAKQLQERKKVINNNDNNDNMSIVCVWGGTMFGSSIQSLALCLFRRNDLNWKFFRKKRAVSLIISCLFMR